MMLTSVKLSRLMLGILHQRANFHISSSFWAYELGKNIKDCYFVLRVDEGCTNEELRDSYLTLAKQYHPDSGSKTADSKKFAQLETAYRSVINHRQNKAKEENIKAEVFDIKHTAPQHRQYLSYEGVGFGTPSKREKHYRQFKAQQAAENVYQYKTGKIVGQYETTMVTKDKYETRKIKTRSSIDRLVEDLVAESMARGDFDNLPGAGKPLDYSNHNPMVDSMTHNLNKILINNGYVPDWVTLEKDIKMGIIGAREKLLEQRLKLGGEPFTPIRAKIWKQHMDTFKEKVQKLNSKVDKLNLTCPALYMQMVRFNIEKELQKVKDTYKDMREKGEVPPDVPAGVPLRDVEYMPLNPKDQVKLKDVWKELKALFSIKAVS